MIKTTIAHKTCGLKPHDLTMLPKWNAGSDIPLSGRRVRLKALSIQNDSHSDGKHPHHLSLPVKVREFFRKAPKADFRRVTIAWVLSLFFCIASGFGVIWFDWTGIPLHFGGVDFYVSLYPPLIIESIWALFFGFWWGAIPAYLTSFTLALYSGMPIQSALVFSMANPLGLAVLSLGYSALPERISLRTSTSVLYFATIAFVSGTLSSLGAFVWVASRGMVMTDSYPIWQGWWVGNYLQDILFVGSFMFFFGQRMTTWLSTRIWVETTEKVFNPARAIGIGAAVITGILMFMFINANFVTGRLYKIGAISEAEAVSALFIVNLVTLCAFGFFAYKFFMHASGHIQRMNKFLLDANENLKRLTQTDELTGIATRRHFHSELSKEVERALRYQNPISLICFDVDHFKKINDTYMHAAGDAVLRRIGEILIEIIRDSDIAARMGGEEFVILLPETDLEQALNTAKRIKSAFDQYPVTHENHRISITASFGVTKLNSNENADQFLASADRLMYQSKQCGRNRISIQGGQIPA